MTVQRKAYAAQTETLADKRQVKVICSTAAVDRAGEIVVQEGIDYSAYLNNPVVFVDHNQSKRVARCIELGLENGNLTATVQFPPEGELALSDQIYKEIKNGLLNGVSIGFMPVEDVPMDKANPKGPKKYIKCELVEFSFVGVQSNRPSGIIERSSKSGANWKVGASTTLPIDENDEWDEAAAAASIFEKAGFDGDHPDTTFARKGFLSYDASNPTDRDSYRVPFAKVIDGRLVANAAGIRSAEDALTDDVAPSDVLEKAKSVVSSYEARFTAKDAPKEMITKEVSEPMKIKSLYMVGELARLMDDLGWVQWSSAAENEYEGDDSKVPAMLADALRQLADALIAMTAEEVAELLADLKEDADEAVGKGLCSDKSHPIIKAMSAVKIKEGRRFATKTLDAMKAACDHIKTGHDALCAMMDEVSDPGMEDEPEDTTDKAAKADMVKVANPAQAKRLREVELLKLRTLHAA